MTNRKVPLRSIAGSTKRESAPPAYDYNNRLQSARIQLGTSSNNAANYCLVYNYYSGVPNPTSCTATPSQGTTGNNGNVTGYRYEDAANPTLQHSAQYTFDGVNRLATATGTPFGSGTVSYNQTYTYGATGSTDRYGNMSCVSGSSNCPVVTFDYSTNHIYQIGGLYAGYDAAGNLTSDGTNSYQWDAENRNTSAVYNALGQSVYGGGNSSLWSPYGEWLGPASATTGNQWAAMIPGVDGRPHLAVYDPNNQAEFIHRELLGSTGINTSYSGAWLEDLLWYPWGQQWQTAGNLFEYHWAQFNASDNSTLFRTYNNNLGRWQTPDPVGGDVTNPQSLNRYTYALNNPTTLTDPLGLYTRGECDIDPLSPDCGPPPCYTDDWNDCNSCDPILGCPGGYGGGHGGRGGRYGGGGGGGAVSSAPPAGQPPLAGGVGFISPSDVAVWQQIEQQYPWIYSTVWACAFAPVCQEALGTAAAGAAAGVLVYEGVQAGIQIYQARKTKASGNKPKPPGWTPDWREGPSSRKGPGKSWWDPNGGEWHWHAPDKWHPDGHWDYNPWTDWNSPWQNVPAH